MDEKTSNMKTAFGLDLAGYSGGNTGFARADVIPDDRILVTVYDGHPFATKRQRLDLIVEHSALEWEWVSACCQRGMLLVDVPIDMQGLPYPHNITFTWELTMRPVDVAFGAMPPFADRIGAPAARFQYVMNAHQKKLWHTLGTQIYETYPAASLALLKPRKAIAYKSTRSERAIFGDGQWNDTAGHVWRTPCTWLPMTGRRSPTMNLTRRSVLSQALWKSRFCCRVTSLLAR